MKQLLQRGSDINHVSSKTGWTPLHWAIESKIESKFIKFLLKNGAEPHIEDVNGLDACDKAKKIERYRGISLLTDPNSGCGANPSLRTKWDGLKLL